jgi:hypothetical protein
MNKSAILETAVLKLEDGMYVYESPLLANCIGAAETKRKAWTHFSHHVETAYAAYLEGRLMGMYDHPGRPAKNREQITLRVKPATREAIAKLAKDKNCSQGEVTDYLLSFWTANQIKSSAKSNKVSSRQRPEKLSTRRSTGKKRII